MVQDKKASEHCSSEILRHDNECYDSLEGENCTPEHGDSSKPKGSSRTKTPTQHDHTLSPAAKPESRPSRRVQFEPIERSQPSEPKQSSWNDQAEAVSPRCVATPRSRQVRFLIKIADRSQGSRRERPGRLDDRSKYPKPLSLFRGRTSQGDRVTDVRHRSMSRKRKERRRQSGDGSSTLTTPCKSCMGSKAS